MNKKTFSNDIPDFYHFFNKHFKIRPKYIGNKAARLADLTRMKFPVPQGIVVSTNIWQKVRETGQVSDSDFRTIKKALKRLEKETGQKYGGSERPLLVSVRSGSMYSMPGMMDTILNVGITKSNLSALVESIGQKTALDSYRRLIQMFGVTVFGIGVFFFEDIINEVKTNADIANDADLTLDELDKIIGGFEQLIISQTGREFPDDPYQQLRLAIEGVFNSWEKEGARSYRKFSGIPDSAGTAVVIQRMVFGNMMNSGTGVLFTRNPRTGSSKPYIEYLACAQG
jgi:pyruvate,orthophosphate dikinase